MTIGSSFLISTIFVNALLAIIVFTHSPKNRNSFYFFLIILSIFLWATPLFIYQFTENQNLAFNLSKFSYLAVILTSISLVRFSANFSFDNKDSKKNYLLDIISLLVFLVFGFLIYKNLIISGFQEFSNEERILSFGPCYTFYSLFVTLSLFVGITLLMVAYWREKGSEKKKQLIYIASGIAISIFGGTITNLILPTFGNMSFYWLGPVFTLFMALFISVAILKHHLFNIRIIATESLVFLLWMFLLVRFIISNNLQERLANGGLFIITVIIGIFLVRSVMREVSQREKIEKLAEDLGKANERLKELDKQKTEFVSIASHQLRSPLTAIKGYSSMLLEGSFGPMPKKAKEAIDVIFQSSQKMISVIEDFLNITRIELGRMKYEMSDIDVGALARQVTEEQRPQVARNGLKLEFEDDGHDHNVYADMGKLNQVFNNLIDNATKYTEEGWIRVRVENMTKPEVGEVVRFVVKDSGVGIPPETLPKLFEKFVRAYDAGKVNLIGTGLGLYVAKQIVEGLDGKIWAESEGKGKGSTFIVELKHTKPLAEQEKEKKVVDFVAGI